jgi:hypothetical protein
VYARSVINQAINKKIFDAENKGEMHCWGLEFLSTNQPLRPSFCVAVAEREVAVLQLPSTKKSGER